MHVARKRFGQHFLSDKQIIQRIVDAITPTPEQHLVEIGPGQGALTLPVLKKTGKLEVIELDRDLIAPLKNRCAEKGELIIYQADALQFDYNDLITDIEHDSDFRQKSQQISSLKEAVSQTEQLVSQFFGMANR